MVGSSNSPILTKSHADGVFARINLKWITRSCLEDWDITTIRISFTKPRERDTCTGSSATCKHFWGEFREYPYRCCYSPKKCSEFLNYPFASFRYSAEELHAMVELKPEKKEDDWSMTAVHYQTLLCTSLSDFLHRCLFNTHNRCTVVKENINGLQGCFTVIFCAAKHQSKQLNFLVHSKSTCSNLFKWLVNLLLLIYQW